MHLFGDATPVHTRQAEVLAERSVVRRNPEEAGGKSGWSDKQETDKGVAAYVGSARCAIRAKPRHNPAPASTTAGPIASA